MVLVKNPDGTTLCSTTASAGGTYSCSGTLTGSGAVSVTVTDPAGNVSPAGTASATLDTTAPAAPVVSPSNASNLTGTAEPGSTVTVINPTSGATLCAAVVVPVSGTWSCTPAGAPLADGTPLSATAKDPAGNTSTPGSGAVDAVAPVAPAITMVNATTATGTAPAGTTVTVKDGAGTTLCTTTATAGGTWTCPLTGAPLADGTIITATTTDPAGNVSTPATGAVDAAAPNAPVVNPSNGSTVAGTAEPLSTVTVTDPATGAVLCSNVAVNAAGAFNCVPTGAPLANGSQVSVTATDAAGNVSTPTTSTVDSTVPATPVVNPTNGVTVSGTAPAGSTITVTNPSTGATLCSGVVVPVSGAWSCTPVGAPLADGTPLSVVATSPSAVASPATPALVDAIAPAAPVVNPTKGTTASGTAEPGSTVTVKDPATGATLCTTTAAAGTGAWTCPLTGAPLADGTALAATATDPAGNTSAPTNTTVDAAAPVAPTVTLASTPTNGPITVSGTAEIGTLVTVNNPDGTPLCQTTAVAPGTYSCSGALTGTGNVSVTATDPAGNTSPAGTAGGVLDTTAPIPPTVNPANGSTASGTAEPGSTVTVKDGMGATLCTTTATAGGAWTCPLTGAPLADGTVLAVTAKDSAGNTSTPASATVDAVAPATPTTSLAPSLTNGPLTASGNAETGSVVKVLNPDGTTLCSTTAVAPGTFSCSGTLSGTGNVSVTATDPAGNVSAPVTAAATLDTTAPSAPVVTGLSGTTASGTAEPGSTVTVKDPATGATLCTTTAAAGTGAWTCPLTGAPIANGTSLTATATDLASNVSATRPATVDAVAPTAPVVKPSNGSTVSGSAEPGSTVTVTNPSSGAPLCSATAAADGTWSCTPAGAPLPNGTPIAATATDPAGNTSPTGTSTTDSTAPAVPTVAPTSGTTASGTAEPGSTVTVKNPTTGAVLCTTTAAAGTGAWTCPLTGAPLANGTPLSVVATDPAGNSSTPTTGTVDAAAPIAPAVNPSNGSAVSGTAEPGSTVTVKDAAGTTLCTAVANAAGAFSCTPAGAPLANGTVLTVTATDPVGNVSTPTSSTVNSLPPMAPVVNPTNGSTISGTAMPGSTVTVTDPATGTTLCSTTATAAGTFGCTPLPVPANNTQLAVTATSPSLVVSPATPVVVDAIAPAAPAVSPTDGSTVSGTAEAGSMVTVKDGAGTTLCVTTASMAGTFSCTPAIFPVVGTALTVIASDAAGNPSAPTTVTVQAPAVPFHIELHDPYVCGEAITGDLNGGAGGVAGAVVTIELIQGGVVKFTLHPVLDANGHYAITPDYANIPSGPYSVHVHATVNGQTADVTYDANIASVCSPVSGTVFVDTNGNGVRDANEKVLGNSVIRLIDMNGNVITIPVNADGTYSLPALPNGTYTVEILSNGVVVRTQVITITAGTVLDFSIRRTALPITGGDIAGIVGAAAMLMLTGAMIVMITRRRRTIVR